ncbi:MAG: CpsD/CapB family tyrosine-protein kinase [Sarcina sp.]
MFIMENNPKSIEAEAYRVLRTNIEYSSYAESLKVIGITSATEEEGKSTTSGNIALSFCQSEKKVLIIDLDLRRPSIHKKFGISNQHGFTEVILGKYDFEECIQHCKNNLDILTSGKIPPNPAEMLSSKNTKEFLESVREKYDYIIVDLPPLLAVTDAQIIATKVDGMIFVVRQGKAKKEEIIEANKLLTKVRANVIGSVLTRVKKEGSNNNYYYYGDETKKRRKTKH